MLLAAQLWQYPSLATRIIERRGRLKVGKIHHTKRTDDDPNGISEFEHLIVNQTRVLD